eukprot:9488312-Pyramimonas_sp.AAC.1
MLPFRRGQYRAPRARAWGATPGLSTVEVRRVRLPPFNRKFEFRFWNDNAAFSLWTRQNSPRARVGNGKSARPSARRPP